VFGSRARPIIVGFSAAVILTGVPMAARAADPTPPAAGDLTPGPPDTPPMAPDPATQAPPPPDPPAWSPPADSPVPSWHPARPVPSLSIRLWLSAAHTTPGGAVTATVRVSAAGAVAHHAVLSLSAPGAEVSGPGGLGDLGPDGRSVARVVRIPAGHGAGVVTVTATIHADHAIARTSSADVAVVPAVASTGGALPQNLTVPGIPMGPPPPGGPPELPVIAQTPDIAPVHTPSATPAALRAASSRLGLDTPAYRLACTQTAWLIALLMALFFLTTLLRLKRCRGRHSRGGHRRRSLR
jgi:hypothetical protein